MANKELRIRELCKERGITQATLANRLGWYSTENAAISFSQAVKRNKFDLDKLGDMVDALNIGITDEGELYTIPDLFSVRTKSENGTVCPHCGKPIKVKVTLE